MVRSPKDRQTADLLDWQPPRVVVGYDAQDVRGGTLDATIARAVALALRNCGRPRSEIARDMSDRLGRDVSKNSLDAWVSIARDGNRIPLDAFAALIGATGENDLLGLLPGLFGFAVVPEKYAELIELHMIEEKRVSLERREAALRAKWRGGRG